MNLPFVLPSCTSWWSAAIGTSIPNVAPAFVATTAPRLSLSTHVIAPCKVSDELAALIVNVFEVTLAAKWKL